jgi:hypothetical protein
MCERLNGDSRDTFVGGADRINNDIIRTVKGGQESIVGRRWSEPSLVRGFDVDHR